MTHKEDSFDLLPENFYQTPFPFGKHLGRPVDSVPLKYMDWAIGAWEKSGMGHFMGGQHDDFMVNLKLYMNQKWVQDELEKELETDIRDHGEDDEED